MTYISHNGEVDKLKLAIENNLNVLITGPTGCGKTTLVEEVATLLNRELVTIMCAEGVVYEQIVGYKDLKSADGQPITTWIDGLLPSAMKRNAILYVDEPNAMSDGMRFYLFSAMDHRRMITIPENNNENVKAGDKFVVVGSMNEGLGYTGTTNLQYNFRDRFDAGIELTYLPAEKEVTLLIERTKIKDLIAKQMVLVANKLRTAKENKVIKTPISSRALIAWAKLVVNKMDVLEAGEMALLGKFPATAIIEKKSVYDTMTAVFKNKKKKEKL